MTGRFLIDVLLFYDFDLSVLYPMFLCFFHKTKNCSSEVSFYCSLNNNQFFFTFLQTLYIAHSRSCTSSENHHLQPSAKKRYPGGRFSDEFHFVEWRTETGFWWYKNWVFSPFFVILFTSTFPLTKIFKLEAFFRDSLMCMEVLPKEKFKTMPFFKTNFVWFVQNSFEDFLFKDIQIVSTDCCFRQNFPLCNPMELIHFCLNFPFASNRFEASQRIFCKYRSWFSFLNW